LSYAIAKTMRWVERRAKAGIGQRPPKKSTFVHADAKAMGEGSIV
jgi:hypothetical protein